MRKTKIFLVINAFVFLAAGCNPFTSTSSFGVVKSINGGADWQASNVLVEDESASNIDQALISKMAFDPQNREHVFASSYGGALYDSQDRGEHWAKLLSKIRVFDFSIHPTDSAIIYAAGEFAKHGTLLLSRDSGKSWNEIFTEVSSDNPVRTVVMNPSNSQEVVVGLASGNLLQSTDGGTSWKLLQNFDDQIQRLYWNTAGLFAVIQASGVLVSHDSGVTFTNITLSLKADRAANNFSQLAVSWNNPQLLYVTTDKALFKTENAGQTWSKIALPLNNEGAILRAVAIATSSDNVVFASSDFTIYKTVDGGNRWQTQAIATTGFINYILIDSELPQIVYAGVSN